MCKKHFPGLGGPAMPLNPFLQHFGYTPQPQQQPPPPPRAVTAQDLSAIGLGPYAAMGVKADGPETSKVERDMMKQIGQRFGCHTCGNSSCTEYTPDHQPPSCVFTGNPLPCNRQLYEKGDFQFTYPEQGSVPSVYGVKQFLYPQCRECSNNQGGICSSRGYTKKSKF